MAAKKRWYAMAAKPLGDKSVAEIRIYDEIGFWGMTAKDFVAELDAVTTDATEIVVSINSPGGDVFDAFAIYNVLRRHPLAVTTRVDGVAASAASLILMAGDTIIMPENAMVMIHNAWTIAGGTAAELRDVADMMDKVRDGIVAAYAGKSGKEADEIIAMMDATTWMTALDAQALGFCDVIEKPVRLAASASSMAVLAKLKDVPAELLAMGDPEVPAPEPVPAPAPQPVPEPMPDPAPSASSVAAYVYATCRDQGISNMAEAIIMSGALASRADADARIVEAQEIAGLCLAAKLPDTAADYVTAGLKVEQVRARLFDRVVQDAAGAISNTQRPQEPAPARGGPNARSIYAARTASSLASH